MIAPALALLLAALPQDTVVDRPVYADSAWRLSLPRPADDWVFVPATERGTTTVIFQPRDAVLSDQLWGALIATHWGEPIPLDDVADHRVAGTWRAAYGRSFELLARDSLSLAGFPAIHIVMGGSIVGAVVDIEEYLVARDSDLVVIQLRTPRGQPRDTVAEGYARVIAGLDLGGGRAQAPAPAATSPVIVAQDGQVFVELPESLMAVAPGTLTSQVVSDGRRLVHWTHDAPGQPDSLVAVGRYTREARQVGRLAVVVWRLADSGTVARATDGTVATAADGWSRYWATFGPVPQAQLTLVETNAPATVGATGIVFLGRDLTTPVLLRELARTWWGGHIRPDTAGSRFVEEWLPLWSAWSVTGVPPDMAGPERGGFERARSLLGVARLNEVLRTFAAEGRAGASVEFFLSLLDPENAAALRPDLP